MIAAVASPAAALVPTAAPIAPAAVAPAPAAPVAAAAPPTAAAPPAAVAVPPAAAAAPAPAPPALPAPAPPPPISPVTLPMIRPFRAISGPAGKRAARTFESLLSCLRKSAQGSHALTWRRAGPSSLAETFSGLGELQADLVAGELASLGGLGERDTGPDEQGLDARDGGVHRLGDLLVAHRVDLAEQESRALGLGKVRDVLEQAAELLAVLHALERGDAIHVRHRVHRVDAVRGGPAKVVEAAVARDPVEPGAHSDVALVGDHRVVGGDEHLLEHVFRVLCRAQHLAAEAQEPGLVALDQRIEGVLMAAPDEDDQVRVVLEAKQRRAPGKQPALLRVC